MSVDDASVLAKYGFDVSRETRERLTIYVQELRRWQSVRNLIARSTEGEIWRRHIVDSLQLSTLASGRRWVDLGSGGGLPGLVLAIADPSRTMILVESDGRKCAFLRHAARAVGLPVKVRDGRIEAVAPTLGDVDVVVARALAPLPLLLSHAGNLLTAGAVGLFSKGRQYEAELTLARESWSLDTDIVPSRTDAAGCILRVTSLRRRGAPTVRSAP